MPSLASEVSPGAVKGYARTATHSRIELVQRPVQPSVLPARALAAFAAAPEEFSESRCMRLAEHVVPRGSVGSEIFLRALRHRPPAQRGDAGAQPFAARQEQVDAARKMAGDIA